MVNSISANIKLFCKDEKTIFAQVYSQKKVYNFSFFHFRRMSSVSKRRLSVKKWWRRSQSTSMKSTRMGPRRAWGSATLAKLSQLRFKLLGFIEERNYNIQMRLCAQFLMILMEFVNFQETEKICRTPSKHTNVYEKVLYRGTGEESFSQEANKENPQQLQDEVENISKLIEENLQTMEPKVSLHYLKP